MNVAEKIRAYEEYGRSWVQKNIIASGELRAWQGRSFEEFAETVGTGGVISPDNIRVTLYDCAVAAGWLELEAALEVLFPAGEPETFPLPFPEEE